MTRARTAALPTGVTPTLPPPAPPTTAPRTTLSAVLPTGLRVLAAHAPAAPLAELRLVIPYARTEPGLAAAQELLAACLGTGSRDRTRQDIADRAADLGAELSTVVTAESLILSVSVLAAGLPGALDLLAELLLRPRYEEGEVAIAQRRAAAAPRAPAPRVRLRRAALAHGFGPHPLSSESGGTAPLLDVVSLVPDDLQALHARAVVPGGSSLVVLAGEGPDSVLRLVGERLAPWSGGPSGLALPPFARAVPRPGQVELTEPGTSEAGRGDAVGGQSLVLTVGPGVPTADPLHAPFHLAQLVLGGYASARLARQVRDRYGLAYDVSAGLRENGAGSWLEIACAGAPGGAGRIAAEITRCLRDLAEEGPSPAEVDRARAYAAGFTRFALATRAEEASALAGFAAAGLEPDWLDGYRERLAAVTREQVAEAAARHLAPDRAVVATYEPGPAATAPAHAGPDAPTPAAERTPAPTVPHHQKGAHP